MGKKSSHSSKAAGVARLPKDVAQVGRHSEISGQRYRQPDEEILRDFDKKVRQNSTIDMSRVQVSVNEGVLNLSGSVPSDYSKSLLSSIAQELFDIHAVRNEVEVDRPQAQVNP